MATLADLNVRISATIDDFEAKMATVQSGIGRVGDTAASLGSSLTAGVTLPLTLLAGAAIKTAADLQALRTGFAATYKGAEPLSDALARVQELAKLPGLGLKEALQGATSLQAAGFSAEQAAKSLGAFGNALATVGKGKAELDRVSLALTQINNTPFVKGQDFNQLREALPQIGEAMKRAFGVTNTEGLRTLGITSKQFIEGITNEFDKLPKVTGGLKNALENLSDAGTLALGKLGDALNKSFNLEGLSDKIGKAVASAVAAFDGLSPAVQKGIFIFAGLVAAAGPVLLAIGAIGAAVPALVAGFALLTGPVGIAVAALVALTAVGVGVAATSRSATDSFRDQQAVVRNLTDAVNPLLARYEELKGKSTLTKAEQEELRSVIEKIGTQIPTAITAFDQYGKALDINSDAVRANLQLQQEILSIKNKGALAEQRAEYKRLTDEINRGNAALRQRDADGSLSKDVTSLVKVGQEYEAITRTVKLTGAEIAELQAKLGNDQAARRGVGGLIDELKGIKPAIDAANASTVKAPIDEAALKLAKDMAKALADVEKSLRTVDNESRALGDQYDYLGSRQSALESGIKRLLDAGYTPGSAIVRKYAAELRQLNFDLGDNALLQDKQIEGLLKLQRAGEQSTLGNKLIRNPLDGSSMAPDAGPPKQLKPIDNTAYKQGLQDTLAAQDAFGVQMAGFNKSTAEIVGTFNQIISAGIADAATNMAIGIGNVLAGAAPIESLGKVLLSGLGDVLIQLGKVAIATGITTDAIKKAFANPYTAIAAGVAAIALGSYIKSASNAALSGGSSGGGAVSAGGTSAVPSSSATYRPPTIGAGTQAASLEVNRTLRIELTANGRDLAKVLTLTTDKFGRVVGV
jgi:tape measure domain-containing protein